MVTKPLWVLPRLVLVLIAGLTFSSAGFRGPKR